MFIFKKEKQDLTDRIKKLESKIELLLELSHFSPVKASGKRRVMSEANKAKASARMKAWHANKKAGA